MHQPARARAITGRLPKRPASRCRGRQSASTCRRRARRTFVNGLRTEVVITGDQGRAACGACRPTAFPVAFRFASGLQRAGARRHRAAAIYRRTQKRRAVAPTASSSRRKWSWRRPWPEAPWQARRPPRRGQHSRGSRPGCVGPAGAGHRVARHHRRQTMRLQLQRWMFLAFLDAARLCSIQPGCGGCRWRAPAPQLRLGLA